jgi:hypothetical protein
MAPPSLDTEVADKVVQKCKHEDCTKQTHKLVDRWRAVFPQVALKLKPNLIYFNTDEYESGNCCGLDELCFESGVGEYGLCVIKDLLQYELEDANSRMRHQLE